jgi:glycosyltransferase involved in cell wall biosynthesis
VRLYRLFRREAPTTVVTHHLGQLVYAGVAARLAGARLVHVEHEYYTLQARSERRLLRAAARLAERVVTVSEEVVGFLIDSVGIPAHKVTVITNGVDTDRFAPSVARLRDDIGIPVDVPVIGTVGRLDPAKDHLSLLKAFRLVSERVPAARLLIVGDGACRAGLEAYIRSHSLAERVHLLGERSDIPALLPCMDVFALSSINEGLPLALLEAMACARPIVTTDVGAAGAVVRRAGAGIVVQARDVVALADAMSSLLKDPDGARRQGLTARSVVEKRYNLATTVDSYLALCGVGGA